MKRVDYIDLTTPDQDLSKRIKVGEPFPSDEELFGSAGVANTPSITPIVRIDDWDDDAALIAAAEAVEEPMEVRAYRILKQTFGHTEFREAQKEVVLSVASGFDTMAVLPTGRGKSLCFQLPALLKFGVTFVVSPLLALMHDQVRALQTLKIPAAQLNSSVKESESKQTIQDLQNPHPTLKIVYITPERTERPDFRSILQLMHSRGNIAFFAVDEAHCISQWGHDFRPPFRKLNALKRMFPDIPLLALTASATALVKQDIVEQLELNENHRVFTSTFNRAEIHYEVRQKPSPEATWKQIVEMIQSYPPGTTGVVYCFSRKDCEALSNYLNSRKVKAQPYHAGLSDKLRKATQNAWSSGETPVVCATIAFGMGIDKPDVRFVIHETLPKTVEGFYQESGRAGRDRQVSRSVVFFSPKDVGKIIWLFNSNDRTTPAQAEIYKEMLQQVVEYCTLSTCRRCYVLKYFGENAEAGQVCHGTCDICKRDAKPSPDADRRVKPNNTTEFLQKALRPREYFRECLSTEISRNMRVTKEEVNYLACIEEWRYHDLYPDINAYRTEIIRRIHEISNAEKPLFDFKLLDVVTQ